MKTIAIEIKGGCVTGVHKIINAPKEGVLIVDHDNLGENPEQALWEAFEDFDDPEGSILDYNEYKKEITDQYQELIDYLNDDE